ncbi:MAG: leucine-rich repeat domain-containing protein [Clostridia bacterium]|nr:leucine-rich repeat domain-containing protein [Clostridia bacterium]
MKRCFSLTVLVIACVLAALLAGGTASADQLTLPSELERIEAEAFMNDASLDEVILPEGITSVGERAFANTTLRRIYLPASLTDIADDAFEGCAGLTGWGESGTAGESYCQAHGIAYEALSTPAEYFTYTAVNETTASITGYTGTDAKVYIPGEIDGLQVVTIANNAFNGNKTVTYVSLPDSVTSIGADAFRGSQITELRFPASLKTIGSGAFASSALVRAELPDSVETIGYDAFKNCADLEYFDYPLNWKKVNDYAGSSSIFSGTKITRIEIPEGATAIPTYAFKGSPNITEVIIADSVTSIGADAFRGSQITELRFPASLKTIGSGAFASSALVRAELPDSVETIGYDAFKNCVDLEYFHYPLNWKKVNDYVGKSDIFLGNVKLIEIEVPSGVTSIPTYAFKGANYLERVILPDSLKNIGGSAFYGAEKLTNVNIPGSVTTIGATAFKGCTTLEKLYIPVSVSSIGSNAFANCATLTVWCEYSSYALDYVKDNSVNYYYLSPDALSVPSGTIYEGDGDIFGYARTDCTTDPSVVLTEVSAVLYQDGSVYRQKTIHPNAKSCNLGGAVASAISISTLPKDHTYRIVITAEASWSRETWVDSTFRVIEKPVVFVWRETGGNPSFVGVDKAFRVLGEVDCNYDITLLEITFGQNGVPVETATIVPKYETQSLYFRQEYEGGHFPEGNYTVTIYATANNQTKVVHSFELSIGVVPVVTDELRTQIREFVNDASMSSFDSDASLINSFKDRRGGLEVFCMIWSDLGARTRQEIFDMITGSENSSYQVQLFELEIADMIREVLERPDLPSFSLPDWYKTFNNMVSTYKTEKSIEKGDMEKIIEALKERINETDNIFFFNVYEIDQKEFDTLTKFVEGLDKINKITKITKWSETAIDALCELFEDHYQDLAVLQVMADNNYVTNPEYNQALRNVITKYETQYGAAMERILDSLEEWAVEKAIDTVTEAAIEFAIGDLNPYIKLIKVASKYLSTCAGITGYGEAWSDLATKYTVHRGALAAYYNALNTIRDTFNKNGTVTDEQIAELQMLFKTLRASTARCYDAMAECETEPSFANTYRLNAETVRNRTMPGVS